MLYPEFALISDKLVSLYNLLEDKSICLDLKAVTFDDREPEKISATLHFSLVAKHSRELNRHVLS